MELITTPAAAYTPPETAVLHHTTADLTARPLPNPVHLVQYDQTVPVLAVALVAGSSPYTVPAGAAVNLRMDKKDGHYIYDPALGLNEKRTTAYFAVTQQMSTGAGEYAPILEVVIAGGVAGTAALCLQFDRNPVPEDAIESTDEYKTVQQLLLETQAAAAAAAASETAAAGSAAAAAESAAAAAGSAGAAAASESAAASSAAAAAASESAAAESAAAAAASKEAAAASASAAAASETAAQGYAEQAQQVSQGAVGYFETGEALKEAHPTAEAGNWAIVGSTDTIWVWDTDTDQWLDTGQNVNLADYYTKAQTDAQVETARSVSYTIPVPASGWSTVAPYLNLVAVPGITADTVLSDLQLAPAQVGNAAAEKAMAQWSMLDTQAGQVQFIAPTARPTADFTIIAREVR